MEVHCVDVARGHGGNIAPFAGRISAGEIETHVVPHDEPHYGKCNILTGTDADADYDGRQGFQQVDGLSCQIEHRDAENLSASIPEAMVDIWNALHDLRRLHRTLRLVLSVAM